MKLLLAVFLASTIGLANTITLPSAGGTGDTVGPGVSVDDSICTFDGITGKLIQDPAQFLIDNSANDLLCASGERCNAMMTSQTVLTSEETFRATTALGSFFAQNNAGTRSVRVGSASSTGTRVGLYYYHPTNSKIAELTTQSSGFSNLETTLPVFPPDFDSTDSDFHMYFNKGAGNATTIGISYMMNGTIWQFARNDGSGNFPVIVTNDPTNRYGVQTRYHGMRMDVINAGNLVAYGSPANGFETYFHGSDYMTGTGNGGDVRLLGGESTGGTGGNIVLQPGAGVTEGSVTSKGNLKMETAQSAGAQDDNTGTGTGTAFTINWNTGNSQVIDLEDFSGNMTLTLSNPLSGASYGVKFLQGSVARTVTWPAAVKWPGGVAPVISVANNAIDLVTLYYDGTNYLGTFAQNFQ